MDIEVSEKRVVVVATLDTKLAPVTALVESLGRCGTKATVIDVSLSGMAVAFPGHDVHCPPAGPTGETKADARERIVAWARSDLRAIAGAGQARAAIGLGGGQGAKIAGAVMAAAPGLARVLVTSSPRSVEFGATTAGMTLIHSATDISGMNPLLRRALEAAAGAASAAYSTDDSGMERTVFVSMLGITTAGAQAAADSLSDFAEVAVFHANGLGGATMEAAIAATDLSGVLDFTIGEITAEVAGASTDPGIERLVAAGERAVPQVVVPGAADILILRGDELPPQFAGRRWVEHAPGILLVRAGREEMAEAARRTAARLAASRGPVAVLIPARGFSQVSSPGQPLADPDGDALYVRTLVDELPTHIEVDVVDLDINDARFANLAASTLRRLIVDRETTNEREKENHA